MYPLKTRFLVVDDQATMRKVIKEILHQLGYKDVVEAIDGQEALEHLYESAALNKPFEFVFSDVSMPRMTGIEFLKSCRQIDQYKAIPFVLITSEREEKTIIEAARAGVTDYLLKPCSNPRIKAKLEKIYKKFNP